MSQRVMSTQSSVDTPAVSRETASPPYEAKDTVLCQGVAGPTDTSAETRPPELILKVYSPSLFFETEMGSRFATTTSLLLGCLGAAAVADPAAAVVVAGSVVDAGTAGGAASWRCTSASRSSTSCIAADKMIECRQPLAWWKKQDRRLHWGHTPPNTEARSRRPPAHAAQREQWLPSTTARTCKNGLLACCER
jgi:hypothetical protein